MLNIFDMNDNALEVEVIRYFNVGNSNYFIYSLNEEDEKKHLKLYAIKVTDELEPQKIEDDSEWNLVKDNIKIIIKGNMEGNLSVNDLDFNKLENIKTSEPRAFKLKAEVVELLKANKKEFPKEEPEMEITELETPTADSFDDIFEFPKMEEETKEEVPTPEETVPELKEEEVPDYSFLNEEEETKEEVEEEKVSPISVDEMIKQEKEEHQELPENNYKILYEEEKELTEVLKSEIAELREKLNQITQILSK